MQNIPKMDSYKIDIGSVMEITGGDSFYKRELNYIGVEWTDVPYVDETAFKGGIGITFDQLRNLPTVVHKNGLTNDNRRENLEVAVIPSLSNIKGKRIVYFDLDRDEQEFPNVP